MHGNYIVVHYSIQQHASVYKCLFQESGDGKNLSESRDSDTKKGQHVPTRKATQTAVIPRRSSDEKSEKNSKESLSMVEKSTKSGKEVWKSTPCCK